MNKWTCTFGLVSLALAPIACGDGAGTGSVQVFVEAEDTIPEGLSPGGDEGIADGWTVTYDRFLVVTGNFRASRSDAPARYCGVVRPGLCALPCRPCFPR